MRSPINRSPVSRRIAKLASAVALFWLCLFARECAAETHVWVLARLCRIEFQVNKEFYVPDNTALDAWIAEARNMVNYYNDFMGPLSVDQLGQHDFYTDAVDELRAVKNAGVGKTRAELLAKIAEWKREVEDKWNAEPYTYNCCLVKIVFRGELRDPMVGRPEDGRQHFDKIAIMIPAPGNIYRSSMMGAGPFDANGFSNNPYSRDLTGNWSFDSESNYEAPHEVGHELGLRDRYHINAAGESESDEGYADSLLGITGDHPENSKVIVRDAAGNIVVDHIRTMLEGMDVKCPSECCPDTARPVRPEGIKRGSWRLPPARPKRLHVASADHIPGSVSAERTPSPQDAVKTPDTGRSTTPDVVRTSDVTRPTDTTGPGGDTIRGGPTGTPTGVDTTPAPPPGSTTTIPGGGPMPISDPVHLMDNSGFSKTPPVSTDYYTTRVPGQKYEAPPTLGVSDRSSGIESSGEEIQYKKVGGNGMAVDTGILYTPTPGGMNVTTSAVATGQGANFRKWEITDIRMNVDGDVINPSEKNKFYIEKASYLRGAAAVTITAIGSQYRRHSDQTESGEVCPVTGEKKEPSEEKETSAGDRAAMAAGMGLLASQARGEIPAIKAVFNLNQDQAQKVLDKKSELQVTAKNAATHQEQNVKIPLH